MKRKPNMNVTETLSLPSARGSDTSRAAADSMVTEASRLRGLVYEAIERSKADGMTCDGMEELLQLSHQTCSPRFWELHKRGLIRDSGRRRKTRSGRTAVVYVLPKYLSAAAES